MKSILKRIISVFVPNHVLGLASYEFMSFVGRKLSKKLVLDKNKKNYINLGSGSLKCEGFINIDFFNGKGVDYGADLRYPLLIDDETVDGIFCEHTMEHLTYEENDRLLKECFRILKKNGTVRIIVPDVSLFVENYAKDNKEWFDKWERLMFIESPDPERAKRRLISKMSAISFVTQEYFHVACWDFETMNYYLQKNNFKNITKSRYRESADSLLNIDLDEDARKHVSLFVEGIKI